MVESLSGYRMRDADELIATLGESRRSQRLSQRDVSRRMGTESAASVCQWETGAKCPRGDHLVEWTHALGYDLALIPSVVSPLPQRRSEHDDEGTEWGRERPEKVA